MFNVVSARPDWVEILVPCQLEAVDHVQNFLAWLLADLPSEVQESVGQACRELLQNAIEWGGKLDPSRTVRLNRIRSRSALIWKIADPGPGFRFDRLSHAAVSNPVDEVYRHAVIRERKGMRPGGLGLLMVRSWVDELIYSEAQNEVLFVRYLRECVSPLERISMQESATEAISPGQLHTLLPQETSRSEAGQINQTRCPAAESTSQKSPQ